MLGQEDTEGVLGSSSSGDFHHTYVLLSQTRAQPSAAAALPYSSASSLSWRKGGVELRPFPRIPKGYSPPSDALKGSRVLSDSGSRHSQVNTI